MRMTKKDKEMTAALIVLSIKIETLNKGYIKLLRKLTNATVKELKSIAER